MLISLLALVAADQPPDVCPHFPNALHAVVWRNWPLVPTAILAKIAEELVRCVLSDHPHERKISLLGISVSQLMKDSAMQMDLPLGLADEGRRAGSERGMAHRAADRAIDRIRERFGWDAVGYGSVAFGSGRSVPDAFRELAEREL